MFINLHNLINVITGDHLMLVSYLLNFLIIYIGNTI